MIVEFQIFERNIVGHKILGFMSQIMECFYLPPRMKDLMDLK